MASIMITGGYGFVGSHLIEELVSSNFAEKIIIVDNMMMSSMDNLDKDISSNVQAYNMDVTDRNSLSLLLQKHRIDTVIHLAVTPLVLSLTEPAFTFNNIVDMQTTILECQRLGMFEKLISFSTAEVYGDAGYGIVVDEKTACSPRTTYAAAKAAADYLTLSYAATFNTSYTIIRLVNNYGPKKRVLRGAGIIPTAIRRIVEEKPVLLFNNGQQVRNFLNVRDTVKATLGVLQNDKANNEIFLLAEPTPRKMLDVVKDIYRLMQVKERIEFTTPRMGDVEQVQGNPSKSRKVLGFEPTVSWEQGLNECIEYYASHDLA